MTLPAKDSKLVIVILDIHPIIRMGLAMLIRQNMTEVTVIEAKDITEFQHSHQQITPGLFISVLNENTRRTNQFLADEIK